MINPFTIEGLLAIAIIAFLLWIILKVANKNKKAKLIS